MRNYVDFVEGTDGRAVAGAFVRVLTYPAGTDALLYADSDGVVPIANPVRTDNTGEFAFYAADGHYTLEVTGAGLSPQTVTDISIFDGDTLLAAAASAAGAAGSAASAAASAAIAAAAAGVASTAGNSIIRATWVILNGITGTAGQNAVVLSSDTGTHTDPVVGGTVANGGIFQYSTAPAGWQRIGDTESISAATSAAAAATSATASATSATASATSATQASGFKDQAAAIAAALGAGGSYLERVQYFTGVGPWNVTNTPFVSVTKVCIDGRFYRTNNFSIAGASVLAVVAIPGLQATSLVDIYHI